MKARFAYLRFNVMSSFWFVPGLMLVGAILLSFATLYLDRLFLGEGSQPRGWLLPLGPEGARLVLATIAGSMITVTSLVFSMTLVTLTMASAQLGPRLLRIFMQDTVNQVVLGTFSATFIYALLILRTVYGTADGSFLPVISVTVAMFLSIASVALLIYFIHHIATSIQADTVIANVARQLDETVDELFPKDGPDAERALAQAEVRLPEGFDDEARAVSATESGYIETVDHDELLRLAADRDLIIRLDHRAGQFVIDDSRIALAWPPDRTSDEVVERIRAAVVIGATRTPAQDVEFAAKALVEVALRALSPGINDEFTALACIDRLGGSLARAMQRAAPPSVRADADGKLRLIADPVTFEGMFDSAFNQIRQAARDHVAVTIRLIETLTALAAFICTETQYLAVKKHRDMIARVSADFTAEPVDHRAVAERLQSLDAALACRDRRRGDSAAATARARS